MAGSQPPRPSSASERKKLIEEYEQTKRSEAERHSSEQTQALQRKKTTRMTILGLALAIALVLAFAPPAWILPPPQPRPTAAEREASIRFSIFLQAQQIEHFRGSRGRLPATLEEAGQPLPGVAYLVNSGSTYQLRSTQDQAISYSSTDSLYVFLGASMTQLGPSQ
jgi:hypothetical protein